MRVNISSLANIGLSRKRISLHSRVGVRLILACTFLVLLTLIIGIQSTALTGFPKGYDSFDHLSVIKIVKDNFPHIFLNLRNYPPLYHFSLGLAAKIFSFDLPELLKWTAAANLALTAIFLFLIVYLLSKNLAASLVAGLFYLASSSVWFYLVTAGLYSEIFAMMILSLAILAVIYYLGEGKEKIWAYLLAVLGVVLVLLSHFLVVMMLGVFLFLLFFALEGNFKEKTYSLLKILLPAVLLAAFFYLPFLLLTSEHIMAEVGKESYEPFALASLFKQGYPGFPFLSIPLAFLLLVTVFLTREKTKDQFDFKFFWIFALLSSACLSYVLGFYRNYFSGINHFLLPTAFFLGPFFGLGLALLVKREILSRQTLFLVVVVLTTMSLAQVGVLKKNTVDMSLNRPDFHYKEARPILFATNNKDLDSREEDFSTRVLSLPEQAQNLTPEDLEGQEPKFVHAQRREIELEAKFTGVVLKENYYPRWKAYLQQVTSNKQQVKELPIFLAGTGMMYVSLPSDYPLPAKVVFQYQVGWEEWLGAIITLLTIVGLIFWFTPLRKLKNSFIHRFIKSSIK